MKYIIFDIDGVLADCSHRLKYIKGEKKDYDKFYSADEIWKDEILPEGHWIFDFAYEWVQQRSAHFQIVFLTARNESRKIATKAWFMESFSQLITEKIHGMSSKIFMRSKNDYRPAHQVKEDLIKKHIGFENILFAFDDDDKVNEMYAKHGVICYKPNITRN